MTKSWAWNDDKFESILSNLVQISRSSFSCLVTIQSFSIMRHWKTAESFDVIRNIDHLWTGLWYYRYCCYFFFSLGMENSKISLGNERNGSWSYKGIRICIYNFRFTLVFRVFQLEAHRKCNGAGKRKWDSQETTKRRKFLQSDWLTSSIMFSPCNAGESLKSRTSKLHRLLYFLANPMYQ